MTLNKPIPTRGRAEQLQVRPRSRFFVDFRRGVTDAISGQKIVYSPSSAYETIFADNGLTYLVPDSQPSLSYTPGGIGYTQLGTPNGVLQYDVNNSLGIGGQFRPIQVAWHGLLPTADVGNGLWNWGGNNINRNLNVMIASGGVFAVYRNSAGATSTTGTLLIPAQQECYVVVQLVSGGSDTLVKTRLAVKKRVAFDDVPWEYATDGTAINRDVGLQEPEFRLHRRVGGSDNLADAVTYRVLIQDGTSDVEDLTWDWGPRRAGLPSIYGLIDDPTYAYPELGAPTDLYLSDDGSYISIDTSPPSDYVLAAPGGVSSPYLYLEPL